MNLSITCRYTGIQGSIDLPSLHGKTLEYTHPLANIDSVDQILKAGPQYLRKLEADILAGIILTQLTSYGLAYRKALHPAGINKQLRTSKKSHLLKAINVLDQYVKPLAGSNKIMNLPKINLDECSCPYTIATTLLSNITQHDDSTASIMDTEEYILRKQLREQQAADAYRRLEIRKEQKRALAESKAVKSKVFKLEDLEQDSADKSIVAEFIEGRTIADITPAMEKLYDLAIKAIKDSYAMQPNQVRLLSSLKPTLFTMDTAKRSDLIDKLSKYEGKYVTYLSIVIDLAGKAVSNQTLSVDDMLETTTFAEKKSISLRDRLAAMKGGAA